MKPLAFALFLGLSAATARADDVPQLKALETKYAQADIAHNETHRQEYITELANLRFYLVRKDLPGWQDVDAEIVRHPVPSGSDISSKLRLGKWISPRHDYLYRADGTWLMDPDQDGADATKGTWSFKGNQYTESIGDPQPGDTFTVILLDKQNFIYADAQSVFYERRPGKTGWPLRRDE